MFMEQTTKRKQPFVSLASDLRWVLGENSIHIRGSKANADDDDLGKLLPK